MAAPKYVSVLSLFQKDQPAEAAGDADAVRRPARPTLATTDHVRTARPHLQSADLAEEKSPRQRGFVVASRPLTEGEDWHARRRSTLLVFERGDVVYGGPA